MFGVSECVRVCECVGGSVSVLGVGECIGGCCVCWESVSVLGVYECVGVSECVGGR